jgi:hypothetical protein
MTGTASESFAQGQRKTITVLFADIKGSMSQSEDLDPEAARAIVDPELAIIAEAVTVIRATCRNRPATACSRGWCASSPRKPSAARDLRDDADAGGAASLF